MQKTEDGFQAVVQGTEQYNVNIVSDGEIAGEMFCSCPNARNGGYCKHMAAVLLELTYPDLTASVSDDMSAEQKNRCRRENYGKIPAGDRRVSELRSVLSWLEDDYSDEDDEISWENGDDYADTFLSELCRIIDPMTEKGEYLKAFEGLKQACFVLETAELNGSLGEHERIVRGIQKYWERIIPLSSREEKDIIFEWLKGLNLYEVYSYMDKEAWETLLHAFTEDRYRDILLNDALFKLQEEGIGGSMFEKYLEKYRELLRYFGRSTECCDNLLEEHKEFMKIIKTVIRR